MELRERWRSGRPEFLVLVGSVLGTAGNLAWIVYLVASLPSGEWPWPVGLAAAGTALCLALPLPLRRRPRSAMRFLLSGVAASIAILLTPPGVVGGGLALLGAVWGLLATARPLDVGR